MRLQVQLVAQGLDTVALVTINGQPVLSTNNMFRTYAVNVKSALVAVRACMHRTTHHTCPVAGREHDHGGVHLGPQLLAGAV